MGRGKSWTSTDDELLCHAWLHVSQDPVRGIGQKSETFWARIVDYYHRDLSKDNRRTIRSVTSRWATIQSAVSRFCGIWGQLQSCYESETSVEDQIKNALDTYQQTHPKKAAFEFIKCWYVLRDAPKWNEMCVRESRLKKKGIKRAFDSNQVNPDSEVNQGDVEGERPSSIPQKLLGSKRAKHDLEMRLLEEQVRAAKQMAEATMAKVKLLEDQVHINLFSLRDDQIPEESRRFFELKRAQVMRELEGADGNDNNDSHGDHDNSEL